MGVLVLTQSSEKVLKSVESQMKEKTFPLSEVYRLLEPGPVVLVTTARAGRANVMPMSWQVSAEVGQPLSHRLK